MSYKKTFKAYTLLLLLLSSKMTAEFKKKKFDINTEQGTIIRGAILTEKPSFNYTKSLKLKNKQEEIKNIKKSNLP